MYLKPYRLRSSQLLTAYMKDPPRGDQPWTVRSLGDAIGVSKSKISGLITGRRPGLTEAETTAIAEALGVRPTDLFVPLSTSADVDEQEQRAT